MGKPSCADGELLVGYRFYVDMSLMKDAARRGAGSTFVVDQAACAGPIFYEALEESGRAVCRGCARSSRIAKRSDVVRRWAHLHRCKPGTRFDGQVTMGVIIGC